MAANVVREYCFHDHLRQDALQEVQLALWEASIAWEADLEETFTHYAWLVMRRKLLHYLTNKASDRPRLSRSEQLIMRQLRHHMRAGQLITCSMINEISEASGISNYRISQLIGFWYSSSVYISACSIELISNDPALIETDEDIDTELTFLDRAISELPEREQLIIRARYLSEPKKTLAELSDLLSISIERVRQIEKKSIETLKRSLLKTN